MPGYYLDDECGNCAGKGFWYECSEDEPNGARVTCDECGGSGEVEHWIEVPETEVDGMARVYDPAELIV